MQKRLRRLGKRASSLLLIVLGIFFVVFSIVVVLVTVSGIMGNALNFEFLPTINKYIIGTIVFVGFFAFGLLFLVFGLRD